MLRLINDEKVISERDIRTIENRIRSIAVFLEKRSAFFSLAASLTETRLYNSILLETNEVIYLKQYKRMPWSKVISHYDNSTIHYNPSIYKRYFVADIMGNIVHEVAHHFNFTHSFKWNKTRKYSTPYYMGYLFEFLFRYYDDFNYTDEKDLADLVTKWRNHINNVIN